MINLLQAIHIRKRLKKHSDNIKEINSFDVTYVTGQKYAVHYNMVLNDNTDIKAYHIHNSLHYESFLSTDLHNFFSEGLPALIIYNYLRRQNNKLLKDTKLEQQK